MNITTNLCLAQLSKASMDETAVATTMTSMKDKFPNCEMWFQVWLKATSFWVSLCYCSGWKMYQLEGRW